MRRSMFLDRSLFRLVSGSSQLLDFLFSHLSDVRAPSSARVPVQVARELFLLRLLQRGISSYADVREPPVEPAAHC